MLWNVFEWVALGEQDASGAESQVKTDQERIIRGYAEQSESVVSCQM